MSNTGFDPRTQPSMFDGNTPDPGEGELTLASNPVGALDTKKVPQEEADRRLMITLQAWWDEAREQHAPNRSEQHTDADFYDHIQIKDKDKADLESRGQAPLVFNLVKPAVDWVIGTERRTRVDWKIHPRGPEDEGVAQAKQHALKYVDDVNNGSFARSAAFSHCVKVGIGWLEECYDKNTDGEPLTVRHEDWKFMWWDALAKALDLSDGRYMHRTKWLDVDNAIALWPKHRGAIERNARSTNDFSMDDELDPADVPGMFFDYTQHNTSHVETSTRQAGSTAFGHTRLRTRVRVVETWFKKPVRVTRLNSLAVDLNRQTFDPQNATHTQAIAQGWARTEEIVQWRMCVALWLPGQLLHHQESPYRHNRFPFTPIIAYRMDKNGMPYGLIRGMRDPQEDYNKRRSKALHLLASRRVTYETGAIKTEDEDDFREEAARPDALLRVESGALSQNRILFEDHRDLAAGHVQLMEQDKFQIFEGSGVTRENLGQDSNAISGRAILAKQQQGAVTTAEIFDNYRFAFRVSGQKLTSLTEQYMTMPKRIRILGAKRAVEWLTLNEPNVDPQTGEVFFENDITKGEADFYVDQQDYRETVRMAMAETLFEVIKGLDPALQVQMLDLAIEMTDIPNRDEFARRIRSMNGQTGPDEPESPDAAAAKQAQADAQAQEQQLVGRERAAKAAKDEATALKTTMDARKANVETKQIALNTAQLLAASIPLAPAADRLAELPSPPQPQVTQ